MRRTSPTGPVRVVATRPPRPRWRAAAAAVAAAALVGGGLAEAPTARAGEALSVTGTTVTTARANATTILPGLSLSTESSGTFDISVSTDVGSLTLAATTGLTAAFGYTFSGPALSFTGTAAAANADLPSLRLSTGNTAGSTAHVSVSAFRERDNLVFSPPNQHFYEYVPDPDVTWSQAQSEAATQTYGGMTGYLATIPNDAVNDFVASKIQGASDIWFGAAVDPNDTSYARVWKWTGGPLQGGIVSVCSNPTGTCDFVTGTDGRNGHAYSHWADVEPNNYNGNENVAVDNWQGTSGDWNDLANDPGPVGIEGYLVEFGDRAVGNSTQPGGTASAVSSVSIYGPPAAPTGLVAAPGDATATVAFRAPADNGGSPVTGYQVSVNGGRTWVAVHAAAGPHGTLIAPVTGLANGTAYSVEVRAVNAAGSGPAATAAPVTPVSAVIAPGRPPLVSVTPAWAKLTIRWAAPKQVGSPVMTGYLVTVSDLTTGRTRTIRVGLVLRTTLTGAIHGHRYAVTVAAFSPKTTGAATRATSATTPLPMPEPSVAVPAVMPIHTRRLAVGCSVSTGGLHSCDIVLTTPLDEQTATGAAGLPRAGSLVVGHGREVVSGPAGGRRTTVTVVLTPHGRELAARVGGVQVTVSAAIRVPGLTAALHTARRIRLVVSTTPVPRAVYFASGSAQLTPADRTLLTALRGRLGGVATVVCAGYTDNRDNDATNIALGLARARATCAYLLAGTHIHAVVRSFGEADPAASNGTPAGRALNRRTELALEY